MEVKNKSGFHISDKQHNKNVRKNRNLNLKIKYFEGLIIENELLVKNYIKEKSEIIEKDYIWDKEKLEKILNSKSKYTDLKIRKLKKYENKLYWQRRRYKTLLTRNKEELVLDRLKEYDDKVALEKEEFLKELDIKYKDTPYSVNKINSIKENLKRLDLRKEKSLIKLDKDALKLSQKILKKNEKISLKLEDYKCEVDRLVKLIQQYNESLINDEKNEIQVLEEKVKDKSLSQKEKTSLLNRIDYLQTKIEMTKNEDIQLAVTNLKMYFGGIKAVNDVSFTIAKNEIFGLIGPNGAGKTTVFNCITQFYKATSGVILLRNKENNIINLNKLKTHDIINEGIARSFQNVELIWELSVLDNLLVASHSLLLTSFYDHMIHSIKSKKEEEILRTKALKILNDLNILEYAYRYPYGLPYGVLKKIELARTLMTDPSMIILDEPAAGLNEVETKELAEIIKKINKDYETTIFLVEHDMSLVMSICDKILAISFGKELAFGTPNEIQSNENVRIAYLGEDD